mmetsp:Transcript_44914/g.88094  ORF Transcript_44914/g.88094 Transcript_44914/m.88094 type:complete len:667 (+) Transcript_44914:3-2003(+)
MGPNMNPMMGPNMSPNTVPGGMGSFGAFDPAKMERCMQLMSGSVADMMSDVLPFGPAMDMGGMGMGMGGMGGMAGPMGMIEGLMNDLLDGPDQPCRNNGPCSRGEMCFPSPPEFPADVQKCMKGMAKLAESVMGMMGGGMMGGGMMGGQPMPFTTTGGMMGGGMMGGQPVPTTTTGGIPPPNQPYPTGRKQGGAPQGSQLPPELFAMPGVMSQAQFATCQTTLERAMKGVKMAAKCIKDPCSGNNGAGPCDRARGEMCMPVDKAMPSSPNAFTMPWDMPVPEFKAVCQKDVCFKNGPCQQGKEMCVPMPEQPAAAGMPMNPQDLMMPKMKAVCRKDVCANNGPCQMDKGEHCVPVPVNSFDNVDFNDPNWMPEEKAVCQVDPCFNNGPCKQGELCLPEPDRSPSSSNNDPFSNGMLVQVATLSPKCHIDPCRNNGNCGEGFYCEVHFTETQNGAVPAKQCRKDVCFKNGPCKRQEEICFVQPDGGMMGPHGPGPMGPVPMFGSSNGGFGGAGAMPHSSTPMGMGAPMGPYTPPDPTPKCMVDQCRVKDPCNKDNGEMCMFVPVPHEFDMAMGFAPQQPKQDFKTLCIKDPCMAGRSPCKDDDLCFAEPKHNKPGRNPAMGHPQTVEQMHELEAVCKPSPCKQTQCASGQQCFVASGPTGPVVQCGV